MPEIVPGKDIPGGIGVEEGTDLTAPAPSGSSCTAASTGNGSRGIVLLLMIGALFLGRWAMGHWR
ncbi:MAG: hypothetical protein ISR64_02725 [Deltaproteobacteria bacterium]|nr:hypothetical protein [Deltaproteobacteria bacterium]